MNTSVAQGVKIKLFEIIYGYINYGIVNNSSVSRQLKIVLEKIFLQKPPTIPSQL